MVVDIGTEVMNFIYARRQQPEVIVDLKLTLYKQASIGQLMKDLVLPIYQVSNQLVCGKRIALRGI